ncbi:hypothetical protein D3C81_1512960 [compost metagenome]
MGIEAECQEGVAVVLDFPQGRRDGAARAKGAAGSRKQADAVRIDDLQVGGGQGAAAGKDERGGGDGAADEQVHGLFHIGFPISIIKCGKSVESAGAP